jgi:hypothetical protein
LGGGAVTTIVVAAGLCSAIRPKLLTAFPPARYPNVRITAWGEGHWHVPCPDSQVFPDADIWVKKHVAHIDVDGDLSFAKWAEYVVCRLIAAENRTQTAGKGGAWLYLMSKPLEPRNQKWAAKWDTLPAPGEWRQAGCKHTPPQTQAKPPARRQRPARRRTNARRQAGGGILDVVARWWR